MKGCGLIETVYYDRKENNNNSTTTNNVYKSSDARRNWSPPADRCPAYPRAAGPPTPARPPYNCSAWPHMVWNTPLASLGQLSWVCPLPAPAAPLACPLAGQSEKLKSPWLSVSTALQQLKHQHVINTLFILIQNIAQYQLLGGKLTLS